MLDLMKLRQTKCVDEYNEEFNNCLNLFEQYALTCFLGGLKKDIQMLVHLFEPTMVQKAFMLARMYEAASTSTSAEPSLKFNNKGILGPELVALLLEKSGYA